MPYTPTDVRIFMLKPQDLPTMLSTPGRIKHSAPRIEVKDSILRKRKKSKRRNEKKGRRASR